MDHDFLLVLDSLVFCHFEKFVFAHLEILLLFLDVEVTILSDGVEDATVGIGEFGLFAVSDIDL